MGEQRKKMEDLFDCEPPKEGQEKEPQTEVNADVPPSNRKRRRLKNTFLAVGLAVIFFVLGGFTVWFSLDKDLRMLMKLKTAIQKHYYEEIDDDAFYDTLFQAVNHDLLDAYSQYMTADEYRANKDSLAGKHIGIGIVFSTVNEKNQPQMLVTRVSGNSPAETAGVKAGDYLTAFGKTQSEMTESEKFDDFAKFLNGLKEGEEFFARVRTGQEDRIVSMSRQAYVENYLFYRTSTLAYVFSGKNADELTQQDNPLSCLKEDTAYIRLVQFAGEVTKRFEDLMKLFKQQGKKNLVLDLRDNGGGYLDIVQNLAQYFCKTATEKKPLAVVADYGEEKEYFHASGNVYYDYFSEESRIYVLADNGTASASECLIGCLVDYGATKFSDICLIERDGVAKTYGKGIMQTTYYLGAQGDAVKLTTAQIRWPVSNRSIHDRGVLPEDGAKSVKANLYGDAEIVSAMEKLMG